MILSSNNSFIIDSENSVNNDISDDVINFNTEEERNELKSGKNKKRNLTQKHNAVINKDIEQNERQMSSTLNFSQRNCSYVEEVKQDNNCLETTKSTTLTGDLIKFKSEVQINGLAIRKPGSVSSKVTPIKGGQIQIGLKPSTSH